MAKAPESVKSLATARVPDITTEPVMLTCPTLPTIAGGSVPWGENSH